ncbi:MAG TPA: hypothetical protein PLZ13_06250, partial [Ottowia sp.]|nr:hypothetical protein [Ottowia sp.]
PGLRRHQKHYAFNSCLRPSRLGKTSISFKNSKHSRRVHPEPCRHDTQPRQSRRIQSKIGLQPLHGKRNQLSI